MGNIWDEFDNAVDNKALEKAVANAQRNFPEIPDGKYHVKFDKLEPAVSKNGKPMIKIAAKILEGKHKNQHLYMNIVLSSDKGVDATANLINGAVTWLKKLEAEDEDGNMIDTRFVTMKQFSQMIMDVAEAIEEMEMEYEVEYAAKVFNPITILGVVED